MSQIILVEDDLDLAEVMTAFFKQKGHQTICFHDSEAALQSLISRKVQGDVILTDLQMPKLSGFDLIEKLKAQSIHLPIIVITSQKSIETAVQAIDLGAFDYVVKPLHFPQLHISVERALHYSKLKDENSTLKSALHLKEGSEFSEIRGKSAPFLKVLDLTKRVAPSKANVFITGESGTGKEVIAKAIHHLSPRAKNPFVAINCSAIPEHLLESELFGHAKGSFTGASDKKIGLFEEADGGTLFLDEIGDMNLQLQAKLLRVLQDRKVRRVGENQHRAIDVRIISATHKDILNEIREGRFREDLFFRLRVIPIFIPALRDRRDDILPLANFFLKKYSSLNDVSVSRFSKDAIEWLLENPWKGNVRELENTIERSVVLCQGPQIEMDDLFDLEMSNANNMTNGNLSTDSMTLMSHIGENGVSFSKQLTIDQLVKKYIQFVLKKNSGARDKTARDLAIDRKTLYRKIQEIESETGSVMI